VGTINSIWTWSGEYFGVFEGADLWTYSGKHVGRRYGEFIYAPDGSYLGETRNNGTRLITNIQRKAASRHIPFTPFPDRAPSGQSSNVAGYLMFPGYEDFQDRKPTIK
jgi:hypothetical protein